MKPKVWRKSFSGAIHKRAGLDVGPFIDYGRLVGEGPEHQRLCKFYVGMNC